MHLVQAYVGFDRKPPLCISFLERWICISSSSLCKISPLPPQKNCFGTSFWIPFYQLCKRIPLDISHDRFLLMWRTAIIQSSLQVFSIFAHVSANSLNFYYPIEKKKKKKKKKEKEYELSLSQYQGPTCHIENLISAEESKASTCQIHVVLAERSKIRVTITKLFFLISFFCHTIKNKLL